MFLAKIKKKKKTKIRQSSSQVWYLCHPLPKEQPHPRRGPTMKTVWSMHSPGACSLFSNLALSSGRTLMARRSYCWLFRRCRSAWSWSWDPPSSYVIRLKELKWLSMPSMPTDPLWRWSIIFAVWYYWRFPGLILWFFWDMWNGTFTVCHQKARSWEPPISTSMSDRSIFLKYMKYHSCDFWGVTVLHQTLQGMCKSFFVRPHFAFAPPQTRQLPLNRVS